jgi:protoporphyrin/coproporphyrin ferrochelatase
MAYYRAAPSAAATPERIGVLLVNLGTPDAPTYLGVMRYLREFLSDRRVIETSRWIWLPLLYGVVLPLRPLRSARNYRRIWRPDGSPLGVFSRQLAAQIDARLRASWGDRVRVELAMSYGNPSIGSAILSLAQQNVRKLVVLPLYPQYCSSTTGSVFDGASRVLQRWRWLPETRFINDYHDDPGFIEALAAQILRHWSDAGGRSHLVFSYHGIPAAYVANGDPYQRQSEATTRLVVARLGLGPDEWTHCYQSRFGRVEWLQPYAVDAIRQLAERGVRRLSVVSPSFAVDCLETLEEVAMGYRDLFLERGGEQLTLVPGLNAGDAHADALTAIIERRLGGWV